MRSDEQLARISARQHGAFTRAQAVGVDLTPAAIRHRLQSGRWRPIWPGAYALAGSPDTWEQRVMAAALVVGGAASHVTAAVLWRLLVGTQAIHVTVSHASGNGRSRGFAIHRARVLARRDVRTIKAIPVTCPARTLVDLARSVPSRSLEAALDRAIVSGVTSLADVDRYVADRRLAHLSGAARLRVLLVDRTEGVPSEELEREFLGLIRRFRLPAPTRQEPQGPYRIDFAYPGVMLAIEVDGWNSHGTPSALDSDVKRQNAIGLAGWLILRFTWRQLVQNPGEVATTIRAGLERV